MKVESGKLKIRRMTEQDIPAVAELEKLCFSSPWSAESLRNELENPLAVFLAAREGDRLAGYAGLHHVLDEGFIANVAVAPDYRRTGVARALVTWLIGFGREIGLRTITLEVRAGNAAARALYGSLGFADVGLRRGYYQKPPEDAVLMTFWFGD